MTVYTTKPTRKKRPKHLHGYSFILTNLFVNKDGDWRFNRIFIKIPK